MLARSLARSLAVLGVAMALAACSGATTPPPQSGSGGASPAGASPAGSTGSTTDGGANGFEGSLTSSGTYSAAWAVNDGAEADPFNASGNVTLKSDKGTFGNIRVEPDGKVSFGSAASELSNNSYDGAGAKVTLNTDGQFVCAFSVDTDLKGSSDGAILHMAGSMTVHWHPLGSADPNCP